MEVVDYGDAVQVEQILAGTWAQSLDACDPDSIQIRLGTPCPGHPAAAGTVTPGPFGMMNVPNDPGCTSLVRRQLRPAAGPDTVR